MIVEPFAAGAIHETLAVPDERVTVGAAGADGAVTIRSPEFHTAAVEIDSATATVFTGPPATESQYEFDGKVVAVHVMPLVEYAALVPLYDTAVKMPLL